MEERPVGCRRITLNLGKHTPDCITNGRYTGVITRFGKSVTCRFLGYTAGHPVIYFVYEWIGLALDITASSGEFGLWRGLYLLSADRINTVNIAIRMVGVLEAGIEVSLGVRLDAFLEC